MVFLCKFGQNPPIGSGDTVQTRLIFTVFIVWWPWKLGQCYQNLKLLLIIPMIQYIKSGRNPSFGSRDRVQTSYFGQNLTFKVLVWPWWWGQGHQNLNISFLRPNGVSMQVWSKSTNWFRRYSADKAHFYNLYSVVTLKILSRPPKSKKFFKPSQHYNIRRVGRICHLVQEIGYGQAFLESKLENFNIFIVWWHCKLGQGHQNLIKSLKHPSITIYEIWPGCIIWFKRQGVDKYFLVKIWKFQSAGVSLKMRSRSPKSNHFFPLSQ